MRIRRGVSFRLRSYAHRLDQRVLLDDLATAGVVGTGSIPTHMTDRELQTLNELASKCPHGAVAAEVGSYLGASCCYLAAALSRVGGRLICVDTWQNETMPDGVRDTFTEFRRNTAGVREWVQTIRKRSDELTDADVPTQLSLVFLDGDHSYAAVNWDAKFFAPRVGDDGILAFHDAVEFQGVAKTIGELLATGDWQLAGTVDNLCWLRKHRPPH
jgi:predicted O-methyltransferase YrrM